MKQPAVFLDRDGTIIEDAGHLADPGKVRLLPRAAEAIRRLSGAGYRVVVVSNQSGVARGLFTEDVLSRVHATMEAQLEAEDARLDGAYYCPFLAGPEAKVKAYRRDSDLRKPNPGMLLQAARELDLDLSRSWMIGDSPGDVEAGIRAGCRSIFLSANGTSPETESISVPAVRTLIEAVDIVEQTANRENREREKAPAPRERSGREESSEVDWLRRIHALLEQRRRHELQHDFSLLRMFATLLQMFALVAVLWGTVALFSDAPASATPRLLLACFLQVAALTTFVMDHHR